MTDVANKSGNAEATTDASFEFVLTGLRETLWSNNKAEPAEKVCKRILRSQKTLDNTGRSRFARRLFGVSQLRRKLQFALDGLLSDVDMVGDISMKDMDVQTVLLVTMYVFNEEERYFPFLVAGTSSQAQWMVSAQQFLGSLLNISIAEKVLSAVASFDYDGCFRNMPKHFSPNQRLGCMYSLPDWLATVLLNEAGNEVDAFAASLNVPAPVTVRWNTLKCATPELLAKRLSEEDGIQTRPCQMSPHGLHIVSPAKPNIWGSSVWKQGLYEVQDEASQLVALATSLRPGQKCVDLCCGRGGKSLHLAAMLGTDEQSVLVCHDIEPKVLLDTESRLRRAGASARLVCSDVDNERVCVGGRGGDVAQVQQAGDAHVDLCGIAAALEDDGLADVVLVDAPCSSLGTLRRGPNVRWEVDPSSLDTFPALQKSLLKAGSKLVRSGGVLVYATCTFLTTECDDVVQWFNSESLANFTVDPLPQPLASATRSGAENSLRLWPHLHGTDGFFIARWRRSS